MCTKESNKKFNIWDYVTDRGGIYKMKNEGIYTKAGMAFYNAAKMFFDENDQRYCRAGGRGEVFHTSLRDFQDFAKCYYDSLNSCPDITAIEMNYRIRSEELGFYPPVLSRQTMLVVHKGTRGKANAKVYKLRNPNGRIEKIKNMNQYCHANGLCQASMSAVASGNRNNYQGWTLP